jgi:hypothetical protein
MSRGLGSLQRDIKEALTTLYAHDYGAISIAVLREWFIARAGGNPEAVTLHPAFARSLRRAIKGLVDRGDILIVSGNGGPGDPRRYTTVECFANAVLPDGEAVKDTTHAKAISAEMQDALSKMSKLGASK